jgi:hypothetical protein
MTFEQYQDYKLMCHRLAHGDQDWMIDSAANPTEHMRQAHIELSLMSLYVAILQEQ